MKIDPVAKPRMTRSDKWKERDIVLKYRAFCDELRLKYREPFPEQARITFVVPMPSSWSKKKKEQMSGMPHQQRPDVDNLAKSVLDALCGDDSYVYNLWADKYWGYQGEVHIDSIDDIEVS